MGLLESFLRGAAETIDAYTAGAGGGFNPLYTLALGVASTAIISFSDALPLHVLGAAAAFALTALFSRRLLWRLVAATAMFAAALGVVAAPLIVLGRGGAIYLVTRSLASSTFLLAVTLLLGWRGLVEALESLGMHTLSHNVALLLRYTPLFLRDAARLLAAREARLVAGQGGFGAVTSVAAELMVRAYHRAYMLALAMEARSLGEPWGRRRLRPGRGDAVLAAVFILLLSARLVYGDGLPVIP